MTQEEMAEKLVEVEARSNSNKERLDKMEVRQDNLENLTKAFSVMQNEQEHIKTDVGEIKEDVKQLVEKPAKRWDGVVDKAITVIVGAFLGFILCSVGM